MAVKQHRQCLLQINMATILKVMAVFASLTHFIQSGASPILNIRVSAPNPPLKQQQANQVTYHQENGGINSQFNAYPTQTNYNNEYADFQKTFQRQQNSPQDSHHNKVKDDAHKTTKSIYRNQQNPQFQNYLYQKQNLHSQQKSPDLHSVNNNVERSSQQKYGPGQVKIEQICTSTGCRNRNDQLNSQQNQKALHEIQQPQVPQYIPDKRYTHTPENYVVESNKNFLHTNPAGNNNRANILDTRKARPLESKDLGQRGVLPYRPHPNSFLAPSAIAVVDTKNKGKGHNTGLVKIEYDFADKDVNDTYETTMELVSDEL